MPKKILKFLKFWLPPLLWAAMIYKFSSGSVPSASESYWLDFIVKKIGHFVIFATLAVLIYRAFLGYGLDRKKAAILATFITFFYGITDEFHQMFTQGRQAKFRDTIIDGFGAGVVMYFIYTFFNKLPKKLREIISSIGIK